MAGAFAQVEGEPAAGQWAVSWSGPRVVPRIGCPSCGAVAAADEVSAVGEVVGAVDCRSCPWWGFVRLDGWPRVREIFGAAVCSVRRPAVVTRAPS